MSDDGERAVDNERTELENIKAEVWKHWTTKKASSNKKDDIVECKYCSKTYIKRNFRCRKHLVDCNEAPSDIKERFKNTIFDPIPRPRESTSKRTKRKKKGSDSESEISDDEDSKQTPKRDYTRQKSPRNNQKNDDALGLFSDFLEGLGMGDAVNARKKTYATYSEDDWKREERELGIRERRARINHWNSQTHYYNQLAPFIEEMRPLVAKMNEVCDMYLSEKSKIDAETPIVELYAVDSASGVRTKITPDS